MKKVIFTLLAGLMVSAQMFAVTAKEVCGEYDGNLNIAGVVYENKAVYLLPGVTEGSITFVLPDFKYNAGKLGNIVLPNIPMDANGQLSLTDATLYIDSISERATINVLNGLEDGGEVYNSIVTAKDIQVLLSIAAPSLPEPIFVLFAGVAANKNYAIVNGGFEGEWTNNEPEGWHSFGSATGMMKDFVIENTYQFVSSSDVRPGSTGKQSALLSSNMLFGVKANGNCTNGQINAGSMTADDAAANYNFSDPSNDGFNTPFHGRPDSVVFWAKYVPADRDAANEVNKARLNVVLTTDARYQDPEGEGEFAKAKVAAATVDYAATPDLGWQRLSVPFTYEKDRQPAYILTTFSTNMLPGGGSSYSTGSSLSKVNVLDSVYLDDVELVYNNRLTTLVRGTESLSFNGSAYVVDEDYCDSCDLYSAEADGVSAQVFFAFDAVRKSVFVYVIADDFAQSGAYSLYRVAFKDSASTEAVDEISGVQTPKSEKVFRNGQLLLRCGDTWFDVTGKRLQ